MARGDSQVKQAFEKEFGAMVRFLQRDFRGRNRDTATTAQAIAALCVGGMVVARAMEDRRLADDLRDACKVVALKLGGWQEKESRVR